MSTVIHYIKDLQVHGVVKHGIQTADRDEFQTAFCTGEKIPEKQGKTRLGETNCEACRVKFQNELYQPLRCDECLSLLNISEIQALRPQDLKTLCGMCKPAKR